MSDNNSAATVSASIAAQPGDVRELSEAERDALIISSIQVDGTWVVLSCYADNTWHLTGFSSNVVRAHRRLDFDTLPPAFREVMKAILYRYIRRGRGGGVRPKGSTVYNLLKYAIPFLRHLVALKIDQLFAATPMICRLYVDSCKVHRSKGKPLSRHGLESRFNAVEALKAALSEPMKIREDSPLFAGPWDPIVEAWPDLEPLQRTYLFAVVLRQAGALPHQDAAAVRGVLACASPDTVVHNPFTNHEGPLCLAALDLAAH